MRSPPAGTGKPPAGLPLASDAHKNPPGVSAKKLEAELDRGRDFARNEDRVRRVVRTTFSAAKPFVCSVPESHAIEGSRIELLGSVRMGEVSYRDGGEVAQIAPDPRDIKTFGGREYYETPNSTSFSTVHPESGELQEFVVTRGIRPYTNSIKPNAGIFNQPRDYVSDLLLFQRAADGSLEFKETLLLSLPEKNFYFEDPRISVLTKDGVCKIFLSGTDYARHVDGSKDLFVRNAYLELEIDPKTGAPKPPKVSAATGKPKFFYLSPAPPSGENGAVSFDAKNGTIAEREDGKIVVRTRFRPDFDNDPTVARYRQRYGDRVPAWNYGVQTFVFDSMESLQKYSWDNALDLLLANALGVTPLSRPGNAAPVESKIVLKDGSLKEFYPKESVAVGTPLGFGPGTRPIRVRRDGADLLVSDGPGAPEKFAGKVPAALEDSGFAVNDGEVVYVSFDHKLRYLEQKDEEGERLAVKRVYTGSVTLWESSLTEIRRTYDDVVQPTEPHQISLTGIMDLHHAGYNMGVCFIPLDAEDKGRDRHTLRVTAGEADAHTVSYDWNLSKLLTEMSPGSEREASGQVYRPEQ